MGEEESRGRARAREREGGAMSVALGAGGGEKILPEQGSRMGGVGRFGGRRGSGGWERRRGAGTGGLGLGVSPARTRLLRLRGMSLRVAP